MVAVRPGGLGNRDQKRSASIPDDEVARESVKRERRPISKYSRAEPYDPQVAPKAQIVDFPGRRAAQRTSIHVMHCTVCMILVPLWSLSGHPVPPARKNAERHLPWGSSVAALLGADVGRSLSIQITWRLPTFGQWAISDAAYGLTVELSQDLTGLENHVHQA